MGWLLYQLITVISSTVVGDREQVQSTKGIIVVICVPDLCQGAIVAPINSPFNFPFSRRNARFGDFLTLRARAREESPTINRAFQNSFRDTFESLGSIGFDGIPSLTGARADTTEEGGSGNVNVAKSTNRDHLPLRDFIINARGTRIVGARYTRAIILDVRVSISVEVPASESRGSRIRTADR